MAAFFFGKPLDRLTFAEGLDAFFVFLLLDERPTSGRLPKASSVGLRLSQAPTEYVPPAPP